MKTFLISSIVASLIATAPNAQMAFEQGAVEFGYFPSVFGADADSFSLDGQLDYQIGQLGLQFDAKFGVLTNYSDSLISYLAGVHLYKPFSNGNKIGAYLGYGGFAETGDSVGILDYRVEGLFSLGAVEVEASVGAFNISEGDTFGTADLDIYYGLSPTLEVGAGALLFFDSTGSETIYRVSATYSLANSPIALGAVYHFNGDGFNTIGITASYSFGGPTEERLFRDHGFPIYFGG